MKVGYSRVSTNEQDVSSQRTFLIAAGIDEERIYTDVGFTGKNLQRAGLHQALAAVRDGDTLVVPKMDRLARNVEDTLHIVRDLTERGVIFQMGHTVYDPRDPWSKLFLTFLAAIAEAEGGWISLRTQEAMARPSVRKKLKGRQPAIPPETDAAIAKALEEGDRSAADVARIFRISRSGVYRAAARHRARMESGR
ncbi:recombinase family protein [Microbacterium sp. VKM Ac-2870]|uniref:recombinase family protein n=1 Tax=Microbacterium sp. VKM Ac-2870 TaxID=2783825 RepID=UPI00188B4AAA|nr:recombinase family protein [Microbacterium sp. VKM Ac-2870]MBF4563399.1 recombinase family protein [Microbacterium sp. VKM Ac-2870]